MFIFHGGTHFCKNSHIFLFFLYMFIFHGGNHFFQRMPPKLRRKTTVESPDSGSDVAEAENDGRVLALMEQIENLMNSLVRQQGNPSNNPIEQVEGRGAGNVDVHILFSNNFNEFKALMQEIKSQGMVMAAFMK